jgi:hypothetical protein
MVKNIKMFADYTYCLHVHCICFPVSLHAAEQDALDALGGWAGRGGPRCDVLCVLVGAAGAPPGR